MTSKIIELRAENFKKLTAVTITPKGATTVIGGKNGHGKTSTLDAIEAALGGKGAMPVEPLRRGAHRGRVVLELDDIIVTRTFTEGGGTQLVVASKDGAKLPTPQAVLDKLVGSLSFDPLKFTKLDQKEQVRTLRELVGVDFRALDAERSKLYEQRTDAGREVKRIEALFVSLPQPDPKAPAVEVSIGDLATELDARRKVNAERKAAETELSRLRSEAERCIELIEKLKAELAGYERSLAGTKEAGIALRAKFDAMPTADEAAIVEQMRTAEATNAKVRVGAERKKLQGELYVVMSTQDSLAARIEEIDKTKAKMLADSKFSVPGLAFTDDGVTLNGLPFAQASGAEKLRASVAIGLALNPALKVILVREGSLLDDDGLVLLDKLATEAGAQVFVERVSSDGSGCTVVIEDGAVVGVDASAGAA